MKLALAIAFLIFVAALKSDAAVSRAYAPGVIQPGTPGYTVIGLEAPKTDAQICAELQAKADEKCAHLMCNESIAQGDFKDLADCESASDYAEAAQGSCEDVLPNVVDDYNKDHQTKLQCE